MGGRKERGRKKEERKERGREEGVLSIREAHDRIRIRAKVNTCLLRFIDRLFLIIDGVPPAACSACFDGVLRIN